MTSPQKSTTSESYFVPVQRRRWGRWAVLAVVLALALPVLAVTGAYLFERHHAEQALEESISATDQLEKGWRLEEIEQRRALLPAEQNAAIHIKAAAACLPNPIQWPQEKELTDFEAGPPQCRLDPQFIGPLRQAVEPVLPALAHIKKAVPLKTGRTPVQWTPDYISTSVVHVQEMRCLGAFLHYLALLQIEDGDRDKGWQTTLMILAVGRSQGEEPNTITHLVRMALRHLTVSNLERCLAQGKMSDEVLAEGQRQLAEEAAEPLLLYTMRAERAGMHHLLTNLEAGKCDPATLSVFGSKERNIPEEVEFLLAGNTFRHDHAWLLNHMNERVFASQLSPRQQLQRCKELDEVLREAPPIARLLICSGTKLAEASVRTVVLLDCARAGIGAERFRLQKGSWPASLDEVVAAGLLDKVPTDPYDGQPLRSRKTKDGVVVYAVGPKRDYAGDALDEGKEFDASTIRYEFRLWDEARRGQPARPRPKVDDGQNDGFPP
jgi:hypothetical protein